MATLKEFFGSLNKDELIFDALVVVSSIIVQKLMYNEIIIIKKIPSAVSLIFGIIFTISLSFMMGIYFAKYNNDLNYRKIKNFPVYMAWLIFPGIFIVAIFSVIISHLPSNIEKIFIFILILLIITFTVIGYKIEKEKDVFKEKIIKIVMYFSAITLSIIEAVIFMGKSMSKHPEKDTIAMILALILFGYIPYRLVIAYAPPINKRNLIFALLGIIISSTYMIVA